MQAVQVSSPNASHCTTVQLVVYFFSYRPTLFPRCLIPGCLAVAESTNDATLVGFSSCAMRHKSDEPSTDVVRRSYDIVIFYDNHIV